ncbi:MAG: DUF2974 domain-containing protein [Treponema sp.]|nr:DUF2974 domain-containing protein [Treponema sp.]
MAGKNFSDICDYIDWRGDLSFEASGLNEVDALIFCQLSYINFSALAPAGFEKSMPLSSLSDRFFASPDFEERSNLGLLIDPKTIELLKKAASSVRFGCVGVTGFVSEYDRALEEQFCAVTFLYKKRAAFVAFRGTDDTIVGWKEDCNLAFMESVPAQQDALAYLEDAASVFKKMQFTAGGHSKGGNLALYAGAQLSAKAKKRLEAVYNFDGPGFSLEALESEPFRAIEPLVHSVFPQYSVIGMLFHHFKAYKAVVSSEMLVLQHNPFSWAVCGASFCAKDGLDAGSEVFFTSFNKWFENITPSQRKQFVETLFGVLLATNATTNSELSRDWIKNSGKIIKAFAKLDGEIRDEALRIAGEFVKTIAKESIKR